MPTPRHLSETALVSASERSPRAQGQRPFTGDTSAAQPIGLDPPGPTSHPSPHLSTVQAGKVRYLAGCLFLPAWEPASGHFTAPTWP